MADSLAEFKHRYGNEYRKIEADPELAAELKGRFNDHIRRCPVGDALGKCADAFFNAHKWKGARIRLDKGESLGRVQLEVDFVRSMVELSPMSPEDTREFLMGLMSLSPADRLASVRDDLGSLPMCPYLVWGFRNPTAAGDWFKDPPLTKLPCVLGLRSGSSGRFLAWGIAVSSRKWVHKPTAFDPGMENLESWTPGGRTKPNPECEDEYPDGLPEVVFRPLGFDCVTGDFVVVEVP